MPEDDFLCNDTDEGLAAAVGKTQNEQILMATASASEMAIYQATNYRGHKTLLETMASTEDGTTSANNTEKVLDRKLRAFISSGGYDEHPKYDHIALSIMHQTSTIKNRP